MLQSLQHDTSPDGQALARRVRNQLASARFLMTCFHCTVSVSS